MAVLKFRSPCSSHPFEFPETFKEQPFSVNVASKQSGLFQSCNLEAKLGEVATFGTYLMFIVECHRDSNTAANRTPVCPIDTVLYM